MLDRRVEILFFFSFSIKEGVLKEVMGIMVSYRVMVKLIVGGCVCLFIVCCDGRSLHAGVSGGE